ncbi:MAG: alpha/beta fold hydrolase [Pyrinomonadaceae bacterium]
MSKQFNSNLTQNGSVEIEYYTQGDGEQAIVLLPGGSLNINYLKGLSESLVGAEYMVILVNSRGAGKSSDFMTDEITLHDLANDVANVIERIDKGKVVVVGHAFGNRVARMLVADHPELVCKVVLLATGGKVTPSQEAQKALAVAFSNTSTTEEYLDAMKVMVGNPKDEEIAWNAIKDSRAPNSGPIQTVASKNTDINDWWAPKSEIPFLALQGTKDIIAPPENTKLLKQDLGAQLAVVEIEGAGHLMCVTKPDLTSNEIKKFLANS